MQWTPQQAHALSEVDKWLKDLDAPQVFHLFGYAGTGKTTLAKHLAQGIRRPRFAAFTGKAALVLTKKGCPAQTIHSLIYKLVSAEGEPPEYELNEDSDLYHTDVLFVDEVSMVDEELGKDLLSFGVRILVMGDPGQLPPVHGAGFFNVSKPEIMLTDIQRQALDNPLIKLSLDIRTGRGVPKGNYGDSRVIAKAGLTPDMCREADQIICGTNETRQNFNQKMRLQLGFLNKEYPEFSERLICLKNNRRLGLFNGGMWTVNTSEPEGGIVKLDVDSLDIEHHAAEVKVPLEFFQSDAAIKNLNLKFRSAHQEFTYGYAITCHKSQGSQWDSLVIWNENYKFRDSGRQWLYTAVTRAAEKIILAV